jgi:hypothetical protein
MLVLHHHPLNKSRKPPKLHFSHQTLYPRSNVDLNSRWLLEWEGVSQAMLMTDMSTHGPKESTVYISCEEGDLALECECGVRRLIVCSIHTFYRSTSLRSLKFPSSQTLVFDPRSDTLLTRLRGPIQAPALLDHPPSPRRREIHQGKDGAPLPRLSRRRDGLRSRRGRAVYPRWQAREREDAVGGKQDRSGVV